jgi:hypothetical protein
MLLSKLGGCAVVAGLLAILATPASAGVVFETAGYTGQDTGEYILSDSDFIGAAFTLSTTTNITGIGAQFGGFPSGQIFGAIVPLTSGSAFPAGASTDLASIALGHVLFSVPEATAIDLITPFSLTLGPGTYGVIFGSGQFGATGFAGLGFENTPVGDPNMFRSLFSSDWEAFSDAGVRLVVEGDAVGDVAETPLPGALPLFATGLAVFGLAARKRKRALAA